MKKILSVLTILLVAFAVNATAPTWAALDAYYEVARDTTISSTTAYDTLIGTADSTTLVTLRKFEPGWEYVLVRDAITGTGSDSVAVYVAVRCFDENNVLLYTTNVATMTAAAGEAILLPINGSAFGVKYSIKYKATTDNGGQNINNRISIWKRRPVNIQKAYR